MLEAGWAIAVIERCWPHRQRIWDARGTVQAPSNTSGLCNPGFLDVNGWGFGIPPPLIMG